MENCKRHKEMVPLSMVLVQIQNILMVIVIHQLFIILQMKELVRRENQPKEIPILIKIKSMYMIKNLIILIYLIISNDVNNIKLNDFENYQFLLTLFLKQKKGFSK